MQATPILVLEYLFSYGSPYQKIMSQVVATNVKSWNTRTEMRGIQEWHLFLKCFGPCVFEPNGG